MTKVFTDFGAVNFNAFFGFGFGVTKVFTDFGSALLFAFAAVYYLCGRMQVGAGWFCA